MSTSAMCDPARMRELLEFARQEPAAAISAIEAAQIDYPEDPRLHFLKGSLLIGLKRLVGAHAALSRAVELDPDYAIARFQLGFFELTSGEVTAARATFAPLEKLPSDHYLRHFVEGLEYLIADRFEECIGALRAGQASNLENAVLNRDMELIIEKCQEALGTGATTVSEEISATSLLLQSSSSNTRRH